MTEVERIDYLVKVLAGGNSSQFARSINLRRDVLSRVRSGELSLKYKYDDILRVYPEVNRNWLETGEGYPGDLTVQLVREHYEAKMRRADMIIDRLLERIEVLEDLQKTCKEQNDNS